MAETIRKKHRGDRKDAWLVRDLDPMHSIMNYILGTRIENEAVATIDIDIIELNKYLSDKNKDIDPRFKYTYLHAVIASLARTFQLRPCMNYFVRKKRFYERKVISFSYVAKRYKQDHAEENIIIQEYHPESDVSSIQMIHDKAVKEISSFRKDNVSNTSSGDLINKFLSMPSFLLSPIIGFLRILDKQGLLPYSIAKDLPYYSSVFISNLGSIKFNAKYHHLTNFGTNSVFVIIGEKYSAEGKELLPISFTIDERIADGVYFANSIKLFKALLLKPEYLDLPAKTPFDSENIIKEVYGDKNEKK